MTRPICGYPTQRGTPCKGSPSTVDGRCYKHGLPRNPCPRTLDDGTPCSKGVMELRRWPGPDYLAPACCAHLTAAERTAFEEQRAADEDAYRRACEAPPACHLWPIPADVSIELDEWELKSDAKIQGYLLLLKRMQAWQADRCAICGRLNARVEDHCHRTGLFRGYLCRSCNTREGVSHTTTFRLYREKPPAVIMECTYQYVGRDYADDAEPEPWVVEMLGPVPPNFSAEAVEYLATAAKLDKSQSPLLHAQSVNLLRQIGL